MLHFLSPNTKFDCKSWCYLERFKQSASLILKKVMYNIAESDADKAPFLREFYNLLIMEGVSQKVKQ